MLWKCAVATLLLAVAAPAAEHAPWTDAEILQKISYPPEFTATVFASPTNISYPIFLSATPDGSLFIGCDENGSLDRKPNRGRVVWCRDTDGDGKADQFADFARMDSPRGVAWDGSTRTLYVMHPPFLTAYRDPNKAGVASEHEDLVTGLGFGLEFRGADHTINGIRLGIDGWIYIACGDYGAVRAVGKDGRSLALRGGGIVRIRPDGSGLEQVVWGTRNILAVALSPTLEMFTRDNTNDGDDWNDRLSFNPFGAQMGYPTLFRNFADEIVPTMIDFGGGSPVGALFLDEPALPSAWSRGFYSVEWGRSEIDLHPLRRQGAGWKAETTRFMKLNRATDLDADGSGHLYASSWDGATFNYAGPIVGYVIQLTPTNGQRLSAPDFASLSEAALLETVGAPSGVWRLAAQREILARGRSPLMEAGLSRLLSGRAALPGRIAALFTLKQLFGARSHPILLKALADDTLREYALKALGDDPRAADAVPTEALLPSLADPEPRVRLQTVTALGHLGKREAATALLERTADADPIVSHVAVQSLRWLQAGDVCLHALDSANSTVQPGALRVLQALYDASVVDGLLARLPRASGELRTGIFKALCRLATREAAYTDPKMWWGTRPDTSGPLYKPERWAESDKIEAGLKEQLMAASEADARIYVTALLRTKVTFPGSADVILSRAGHDTASRLDVMSSLLPSKTPVPEELIRALTSIATSTAEVPELRARAFRLLHGMADRHFAAVRDVFVSLSAAVPTGPLGAVWEEFTRDARFAHNVRDFAGLAKSQDAARRLLGDTVLVNLATSTVVKDKKAVDAAEAALREIWTKPDWALSLLEVIGRTRATRFASDVRELAKNDDPKLAQAAAGTLEKLGVTSDGTTVATSSYLGYEEAVKIVLATKGDPRVGEQLFLKQGCVLCHTISAKDPPKGPMLGGISARYSRLDLCESILKPSAKIAQGFESQHIVLAEGDELDGFVVREGGDSLEIRNVQGGSTVIEKARIRSRAKREQSIMPEGLVANIAAEDLASLIAFLESTRAN